LPSDGAKRGRHGGGETDNLGQVVAAHARQPDSGARGAAVNPVIGKRPFARDRQGRNVFVDGVIQEQTR